MPHWGYTHSSAHGGLMSSQLQQLPRAPSWARFGQNTRHKQTPTQKHTLVIWELSLRHSWLWRRGIFEEALLVWLFQQNKFTRLRVKLDAVNIAVDLFDCLAASTKQKMVLEKVVVFFYRIPKRRDEGREWWTISQTPQSRQTAISAWLQSPTLPINSRLLLPKIIHAHLNTMAHLNSQLEIPPCYCCYWWSCWRSLHHSSLHLIMWLDEFEITPISCYFIYYFIHNH